MKIIGCQGPISASSIQTQISEVDGLVDALRERNEVNFFARPTQQPRTRRCDAKCATQRRDAKCV